MASALKDVLFPLVKEKYSDARYEEFNGEPSIVIDKPDGKPIVVPESWFDDSVKSSSIDEAAKSMLYWIDNSDRDEELLDKAKAGDKDISHILDVIKRYSW